MSVDKPKTSPSITGYISRIRNLFFLLGLLCYTLSAEELIHWKGVLNDSVFSNDTVINMEVLETGDTFSVALNSEFELLLPKDTIWNICFSSALMERCYEVVYLGQDTTFSAEITGNNYRVYETAKTDTAEIKPVDVTEIDSTLFESSETSTFNSDQTVRLKKVLLRVRKVPRRALGKSTVSAKMIKRMPGLAEADVIKSIQALPGVVASSDFSSKIYVRGGRADQNLFLLDNGVIFSPVHFFGLFSTFLVECVDEVDFYKGGFAPEYGNRLSSVIDIKSRQGGQDTVNSWFKGSSLKVSTFATQVHTEGHQGKLRWIAAGRSTYIKEMLTFLRKMGFTEVDIDYRFYDQQGIISYDFNEDHKIDVSFYRGKDKLDFTPVVLDWGNELYPVNYKHKISEHWRGQATLSYSKFEQNFSLQNIFGLTNNIELYNYKHRLDYTGLSEHILTAGTDIKYFELDFINDQPVAKFTYEEITKFWLSGFFLQDAFPLQNLDITLGSRFSHSSTLKNRIGIEPRISLTYNLPTNQFLDFHVGYYEQYINSLLFGDFETVNEFYYPAKKLTFNTVLPSASLLTSAGYRKEKLWDNFSFSLEGYYKTFYHLLVFAQDEAPDSVQNSTDIGIGDLLKEAEGYSLGGELLLRRESGKLFGGISYSRGMSVVLEENDAVSYYPSWHQAHSLKADLAINWKGKDGIWKHKKKGRYLRSSTQLKWATGLPYTEYIGYVPSHLIDQGSGNNSGGPNPIYNNNISTPRGNRNTSLVPPYMRWDAKIIDMGREKKWNLSWTILNLTDHENIFMYFYNTGQNPPELVEITQFPFFPILLSFEYYF